MRHLLYRRKPCSYDTNDSIDALVALQRLEEQECQREQEFFRITGEMQQFGCSNHDLEDVLPDLLQTRREHALYDGLVMMSRNTAVRPGFPVSVKARRTGDPLREAGTERKRLRPGMAS